MTGTAEIKEGKGVLSLTAIPCRKNVQLSFFRTGTSFAFDFQAHHRLPPPPQVIQSFLLSLAEAMLISWWSQSMSHWSYTKTLRLSALLNQSHHNYPLGFDLVNVCPNTAPQRESNEPLLKEGRTAGIILAYNYTHKHTPCNRLKSFSCYSSNCSSLIPLVTKLLIVLFLSVPLSFSPSTYSVLIQFIYTVYLGKKRKGRRRISAQEWKGERCLFEGSHRSHHSVTAELEDERD